MAIFANVRFQRLIATICLLPILIACRRSAIYAPEARYDCLNGYAVVRVDGRWGLESTTSGALTIPAAYDSLFMYSDNLAFAFLANTVTAFSSNGGILGRMDLVTGEQPEELYERWVTQSNLYEEQWESLVCGFEKLCRDSALMPLEEVNKDAENMLSDLARIQGGNLSPAQLSRLETAKANAVK